MRKKNLLVAVWVTGVLLFAGKNICHAEKLFVGYAGLGADLSHVWIFKEAGLFKNTVSMLCRYIFPAEDRSCKLS